MRLSFHGGAMEVGRSCIAVDDKFLFDAGLKISEEGSEYPELFDVRKIQGVFLSHAHLDHNGALPLFNYQGLRCPIYCNSMTKELTKILLKDSLHIEQLENQEAGYSKENIYNVLGLMQNTQYNKWYKGKDCSFRYLNAGHIPGSASVILEYKKKKILYTGDINTASTHLMKGGEFNTDKIDVMICESTYGDRNHPARNQAEDKFLDKVQETLDRGGSVLIPAFAVGRSQEILLMLNQRKWNANIYLDGMAKQVSNVFLRKPEFIGNKKFLENALRKVSFVKKPRQRKEIVKEQSIIVTTSGMLDGGPVIDYLASLYFDSRSSVLMTGYQAEETNGRLLLEQGKVYIDGSRFKVRGTVEKYDFSAHAGQKELVRLIKRIAPKDLILNHGDKDSINSMGKMLKDTCNVHMPNFGDTIDI